MQTEFVMFISASCSVNRFEVLIKVIIRRGRANHYFEEMYFFMIIWAFRKCLRQHNWRLVGSKGIASIIALASKVSEDRENIRSGFELGIVDIFVNWRRFIVYDSR